MFINKNWFRKNKEWRCIRCLILNNKWYPVYYEQAVRLEKLENVFISICTKCGHCNLYHLKCNEKYDSINQNFIKEVSRTHHN